MHIYNVQKAFSLMFLEINKYSGKNKSFYRFALRFIRNNIQLHWSIHLHAFFFYKEVRFRLSTENSLTDIFNGCAYIFHLYSKLQLSTMLFIVNIMVLLY